jgi:hypothetical protein
MGFVGVAQGGGTCHPARVIWTVRWLAFVTLMLASTAGRQAWADLPQTFDLPTMADDYRLTYGLSTGIWDQRQVALNHTVALQMPLRQGAVGAELSLTNLIGDLTGSSLGNLRLHIQWFQKLALSTRNRFLVGGGLDFFVPTSTSMDAESDQATLVAGAPPGDAGSAAPDAAFTIRPRLQVGTEVWIFSAQLFGATAVQFVGQQARFALEWGVNLAAYFTRWMALAVEATGVSWLDTPPDWMDRRVVNLGLGLRFATRHGLLPAVWLRVPVVNTETSYGGALFINVELSWFHERNWFLF